MITGISIHAPREGGDHSRQRPHNARYISIHAPREGGDEHLVSGSSVFVLISIHAPREGGDWV